MKAFKLQMRGDPMLLFLFQSVGSATLVLIILQEGGRKWTLRAFHSLYRMKLVCVGPYCTSRM